MRRFDKFDEQRKAPPQTNGHANVKQESPASPQTVGHSIVKERSLASQQTNGHTTVKEKSPVSSEPTRKAIPQSPKKHKQESDEGELSDVKDSPPPKKKKKIERDSDAAYAAKLQAEENARTRSTRGGGPKAPPVKKKKKIQKKKTSAKVKAEDDSDIDGSGSDVKEKVRSGGFHASLRRQPDLLQTLTGYRKSLCYLHLSQLCWTTKSRYVSNDAFAEVFEPLLMFPGSYLGLRQSSAFGRTCVPTTFKIQVTSE